MTSDQFTLLYGAVWIICTLLGTYILMDNAARSVERDREESYSTRMREHMHYMQGHEESYSTRMRDHMHHMLPGHRCDNSSNATCKILMDERDKLPGHRCDNSSNAICKILMDERDKLEEPLLTSQLRWEAFGIAVCTALVWPLTASLALLYVSVRTLLNSRLFVTPTERVHQQALDERRELEELREAVRKYKIKGGEDL